MGVWSEIEGSICIPKRNKISVREVAKREFGDEFSINLDTRDYGQEWFHEISIMVELEGESMMERMPKFLAGLEASYYDLECHARFIK